MIDLLEALPERRVDARLSRLYRRFGAKNTFSVAQGADALQIDMAVAWRILYIEQIEDSRFRAAVNNGKIWLIPLDVFHSAAKAWAEQYHGLMRTLPVPFSAQQFADAGGLPFASANTLLSVLARYGHLRTGQMEAEGQGAIYRLPPRRIMRAA